jgi:CSLREA domain-containing protein
MSRLAVVAIVSAFAILEFPTRAWGLVIPVTSTADAPDVMPGDGACATSTGDCTLRAAIDEVAALVVPPASVTIALPAGHYGITLGDLTPGCAGCVLAIEGAGASTTIVEASPGGAMVAAASPLSLQGVALSHVGVRGDTLDIADCEISAVHGYAVQSLTADVAIRDTQLTNDEGGVDARSGTLEMDRVRVTGCTNGAGIALETVQAEIRDSEITDNAASAITGGSGSGVLLERSTVARNSAGVAICGVAGEIAVVDSVISDHQLAGIDCEGAVRVEGSTISRNGTYGVLVSDCTGVTPSLRVDGSTIEANAAGGALVTGIGTDGFVMSGSLVRAQAGFGIALSAGTGGGSAHIGGTWVTGNGNTGVMTNGIEGRELALTIDASTISDNFGEEGAGLLLFGSSFNPPSSGGGAFLTVDVSNSTISQNRAAFAGGGIHAGEEGVHLSLRNCTIVGNASETLGIETTRGGGGIWTTSTGGNVTAVSNTILAGNTSGTGVAPDCDGPLTSEGYNLIGDVADCSVTGDQTGNLIGANPLLAPLADNGGPTPTHALLPGSPALDAGNPAAPGSGGATCTATDQRGIVRPIGPRCDIGALEDTCGNGVPDPGEPCSCPPQPEGLCTTTTTTTSTSSTTSTTIVGPSTTMTTTTVPGTLPSTTSTTLPGSCPPAPRLGCVAPEQPAGSAQVVLRHLPNDTRDRLRWRWSKGAPATLAEFGDPLTTDDYTACIYSGSTLYLAATIPAGARCGSDPCWERSTKGLRYRDRTGAHGGIERLDVQASGKRGAKISLRGAGHALGLGTPLPVVPLRVQVQAAAGCWEAEYPEAKANDGTTVRATVK